jgi:hypothetical protein
VSDVDDRAGGGLGAHHEPLGFELFESLGTDGSFGSGQRQRFADGVEHRGDDRGDLPGGQLEQHVD